jgi:hypothetical protein
MAGVQQSDTDIRSPFGGLPTALAGRTSRQLINPLLFGLGVGAGPRANRFLDRLSSGGFGGPLAGLITGIQDFVPGVLPEARAAASQISAQAPVSFAQLQGQISTALDDLTGLRTQSGDLTTQARNLVDQAFSPIAGRALFQETFRRATDQLQPNLAARGLLGSGEGAQLERDIGRDLALEFGLRDQANQTSALGTLGSAIQNQLGVTQSGIPIANAELAGLGSLGQLLQFANQLPLGAASNVLSLLTAGLGPGIQLTGATAPVLGSESKGTNVLTCIPIGTPVLAVDDDATPPRLALLLIETLGVGDRVLSTQTNGEPTIGTIVGLVEKMAPPRHALTHLTIRHRETGQGFTLDLSTTHPLGDGRVAAELRVGETWGSFTIVSIETIQQDHVITRDLLIDSPTGLYFLGHGFAVGSVLDERHRPKITRASLSLVRGNGRVV